MADSAGSQVDSNKAIEQGLTETCQKVLSSVARAVEEHVNSTEFSPQHGLDFLDTKNSLLLSYLIDLTLYLRNRLMGKRDDANLHRLVEMRTVLDKMRNLDKRLRYQIDKLLAAQSNASSFAAAGDNNNSKAQEDPLQFRPSVDAMEDNGGSGEDSSSSGDDEDSPHAASGNDKNSDDDDLASARRTLRLASQKDKEQEDDSNVYRAPRLAAVPYTHDKEDRQAEKEKRQRRRMRASELAQALRSQYGDVPEQQDIHGGTELGKQREAARRLAEREAEKTKFEEDQMVRLTTTRKEKKERRRLMRSEGSNLAAIADLGNLVRDASLVGGNNSSDDEADSGRKRDGEPTSGRHASGKRRRHAIDSDGRAMSRSKGGGKRSLQSKNSLQAALFEGGGGGKSNKKKNKKR